MSSSVIVFQASICSRQRLHYFRQIVSMPSSRVAPPNGLGQCQTKVGNESNQETDAQHNQTGIVEQPQII